MLTKVPIINKSHDMSIITQSVRGGVIMGIEAKMTEITLTLSARGPSLYVRIGRLKTSDSDV